MGKKNKHLMDYREREVVRSMGVLPLDVSVRFMSKHHIEDEIALYETINPENIEELIEFTTAEDIYEAKQLHDVMEDTLNSLSPREAKILKMRFGIGVDTDYTLEEVGEYYGITRERIRQIEAKALRKMRHPSRSDKIKGEPLSLYDIAYAPAPERDTEFGWDIYDESRHQDMLRAWGKKTIEAKMKLEEIKLKLKGFTRL